MNALLQSPDAPLAWSPCAVDDVDAMLAIEQQVYSHPWSRGNFIDSLSAAHWAWKGCDAQGLLAYWLALPVLMAGVMMPRLVALAVAAVASSSVTAPA